MKKLLIAIMGMASAVNAIALEVGCPTRSQLQLVGPEDKRCRLSMPEERYCYIYQGDEGTWFSQSVRGQMFIYYENAVVAGGMSKDRQDAYKLIFTDTGRQPGGHVGVICNYGNLMVASPEDKVLIGIDNGTNWYPSVDYGTFWSTTCKNGGACRYDVFPK